ncbi:MAG: hypothetical protein FJ271_31295 [Planctomycetes bacterium]|nr:hypothetical protein [Planctomycetota bacterium]
MTALVVGCTYPTGSPRVGVLVGESIDPWMPWMVQHVLQLSDGSSATVLGIGEAPDNVVMFPRRPKESRVIPITGPKGAA